MALNPHPTRSEERDARLDRLYPHAGREAPRKEIDDAIKAAARREVHSQPRPMGAQVRRWGLPLSIAAVVVVSVSLVSLMREEGADRPGEGYPPPAQMESKEKREPSGTIAGGSLGDAGADEKAAIRPPVPALVPQAPPARAPSDIAAPASNDSPRARESAGPAAPRPEEAPVLSQQARERAAYRDDKGLAPQALLGRQSAGKKAESVMPESVVPGAVSEPARRLQSAPARADQEGPAKQMLKESEHLPSKDRVALIIRSLDQAKPESWLKEIEALRREGRDEEADAVLKEFRRRFPEHPLAQPGAADVR